MKLTPSLGISKNTVKCYQTFLCFGDFNNFIHDQINLMVYVYLYSIEIQLKVGYMIVAV